MSLDKAKEKRALTQPSTQHLISDPWGWKRSCKQGAFATFDLTAVRPSENSNDLQCSEPYTSSWDLGSSLGHNMCRKCITKAVISLVHWLRWTGLASIEIRPAGGAEELPMSCYGTLPELSYRYHIRFATPRKQIPVSHCRGKGYRKVTLIPDDRKSPPSKPPNHGKSQPARHHGY